MHVVAQGQPDERATFIRKTYTHLAGAVGAFILLETLLIQSGIAEILTGLFMGSRFGWLGVIAGFSLLGWFSRSLAAKADSIGLQYTGLGIYVVMEALPMAGILTSMLFAGLTMVVFTTGKDFNFLGGALKIAGCVALGLIVCSTIFGFTLGLVFSVAMVVFAMAAILYDTSKIMHNYSSDQYVAASLELFASVALLFWYVLRILMSLNRR
jgi:uncharacterized protein